MSVKLFVWEALCVALFWSVFCRSVRMDKTTKIDIRVSIWLLGLASLLGFGAPLYGWEPDIVTLVIVGAGVLMQAIMAQHWSNGVPDRFIDSRFLPRHRRKEDRI
jgi:hypothetical protein